MQTKKYKMLILILILVMLLSGMLMFQFLGGNYAVMGKKLSSWNGEYTIGVPRNWDSCEPSTSSGLIAAKTSRDDMFMMLTLDGYDYGPDVTLDSYISSYISYVGGNSDQQSETKMVTIPETITVDGMDGYYYEYTAPVHGMQVHVFCFATDTPDGFLAIQVASNEAMADENRKMAKGIISSLRVHKEEPAPAADAEQAAPSADAADAGGEAEAGEAAEETDAAPENGETAEDQE